MPSCSSSEEARAAASRRSLRPVTCTAPCGLAAPCVTPATSGPRTAVLAARPSSPARAVMFTPDAPRPAAASPLSTMGAHRALGRRNTRQWRAARRMRREIVVPPRRQLIAANKTLSALLGRAPRTGCRDDQPPCAARTPHDVSRLAVGGARMNDAEPRTDGCGTGAPTRGTPHSGTPPRPR